MAVLAFFKYTNFFIVNINTIGEHLGTDWKDIKEWNLLLPVGLSFYVFQSLSYLNDVYRNHMRVESNFIRYFAFVSYFPTVLSGPIQKSRELLPQIKNPPKFSYYQMVEGVLLFIWGSFEKVCVANRLFTVYKNAYSGDFQKYSSYYCVIGAISFSLYIYSDFSGYSDMARGIAKMMGIDIGRNFLTPYLSTSLTDFWRRWHVSLNDWFIENVYIPLGGNRRGKIRKYLNSLIVFILSGLWHGAAWHFIIWGVLNGGLMIIGQIIKPFKDKIYQMVKIRQYSVFAVWLKRGIVFSIITITWIFFDNGIYSSLIIIKKILSFAPETNVTPSIFTLYGSIIDTIVTIFLTSIFCTLQYKRKDINEHIMCQKFLRAPAVLQIFLPAIVLAVVIYFVMGTNSKVNTSFVYFQF